MKRFMLTVALTSILSVSVLAGESPTCGLMSPPPPPVTGTTATGDDGSTDSLSASGDMSDLLTAIVLEIITWP